MTPSRHASISEIGRDDWQCLEAPNFPFFDYDFLLALEEQDCLGKRTGWYPCYLVLHDHDTSSSCSVQGAVPLYVKTNSYGEYIFDWSWAHAYRVNGLSYYPKLVSAVPFTPATGPRLLVNSDRDADQSSQIATALLHAAVEHYDRAIPASSSFHVLFLPETQVPVFENSGFLIRHTHQFHWRNRSFGSFSEFIETLNGKRRRQILRERHQLDPSLSIERLSGSDLTQYHADVMFEFYESTIDRKQAHPYLSRGFFHQVFADMSDRIVLILASKGDRPVAGALNFQKGHTLFGRYWGSRGDYRNLHFELCYYQTVEYAIERQLVLFEAGAQGPHKMQRGFLPCLTYSAHLIKHPGFRRVIAEAIEEERQELAAGLAKAMQHHPFK